MRHALVLLFASAAVFAKPIPVVLWAQTAVLPPGTNSTVRTEVVQPAAPSGAVPAAMGVALPAGAIRGVTPGAGPGAPVGPGANPPQAIGAPSGASATETGLQSNPSGASPGTAASGSLSGDPCRSAVLWAQTSPPANGGPVEVQIAPLPASCPAPALGVTGAWLVPIVSPGPGRYRFSAAPNTGAEARSATLVLGEQVLRVTQGGLPTVRAAVAPSRLMFGMQADGRIEAQRIRVWAEGATDGLNVSATAPWVRISKATMRKGVLSAEVSVDTTALPAGARHDAELLIVSGQPDRAPLRVPVIAERGRLR
ncbi:MAG TPA: hypothetical protein VES20_03675 [Bryobacteraceae bacterium]|nr:hypothetical protein [Bryobacteraceae bacterium]